MKSLALILSGVLLNAGAQVVLKMGMRQIGYFDFSFANVIPIGWRIATNLYVALGISFYVASVVIWLLVLSRSEVSFAYPMLSVGYIVTALIGFYVFGENLSIERIGGIVLIVAGVFLIART